MAVNESSHSKAKVRQAAYTSKKQNYLGRLFKLSPQAKTDRLN